MFTAQQIRFFGAFRDFEAKKPERPDQAFFRLAKDRGWHSDSTIFRELWLECLGYEFPLQPEGKEEISVVPQPSVTLNSENLDKLMKELTIAGAASSAAPYAKPVHTATTSSLDHGVIVRYFDTHEGFEPDNTAPLRDEFEHLAKQQKWASTSDRYREEFVRCCAEEFRYFSGDDDTKLEAWQKLCGDLGIETPPSLSKCRKALRGCFINIFDFVDCKRAGRTVGPIFDSLKKFRKYTLAKNVFPKAAAKQNPFLSVLLEKLIGRSGVQH